MQFGCPKEKLIQPQERTLHFFRTLSHYLIAARDGSEINLE